MAFTKTAIGTGEMDGMGLQEGIVYLVKKLQDAEDKVGQDTGTGSEKYAVQVKDTAGLNPTVYQDLANRSTWTQFGTYTTNNATGVQTANLLLSVLTDGCTSRFDVGIEDNT